jgi:hypothetical protein
MSLSILPVYHNKAGESIIEYSDGQIVHLGDESLTLFLRESLLANISPPSPRLAAKWPTNNLHG